MSKTINGKKPLSTKSAPILSDDYFGNRLALPADIQKDLDERGLVARWASAVELNKNQGYHTKGWIPYKRKKSDTMDTKDFLGGQDPEGYVRRGDAVLVYKTSEEAEKQRSFLRDRAQRQLGYGKRQAAELKHMIREGGLEGKVHSGYDSDEDEE